MPDGRLLPVRCGASNRCRYCSWLAAMENAYVVRADAEVECPEVGFTLTTRRARTAPADFRESMAQTMRALRGAYPEARYLAQIEFTTGGGPRSGGHRRIHAHGLLKGVRGGEAPAVEGLLREVWLRRTGAHRVEAHEIRRPAGTIAYLINHHQKQAQTPPQGWSGKRLRPSKGYYSVPVAQLRHEASRALSEKATRRAIRRSLSEELAWDALDPEDAARLEDEFVRADLAAPGPVLVTVDADGRPVADDLDVQRAREAVRRAGVALSLQAGSRPAPAP